MEPTKLRRCTSVLAVFQFTANIESNDTLIIFSSLLSICFYDFFRAFYVTFDCAMFTSSWVHDSSAFCPTTVQPSDSPVIRCHSKGRRFRASRPTGSTLRGPAGLISNTPCAPQTEDGKSPNKGCILCQTVL